MTMDPHDIQARKAALESTIASYQRQIDPLQKELKELEKLEAKTKKTKDGA
jgi:prefoldin subunit 5